MVIIFSKTLEKKKGGDHVRAKDTEYLLLVSKTLLARPITKVV